MSRERISPDGGGICSCWLVLIVGVLGLIRCGWFCVLCTELRCDFLASVISFVTFGPVNVGLRQLIP